MQFCFCQKPHLSLIPRELRMNLCFNKGRDGLTKTNKWETLSCRQAVVSCAFLDILPCVTLETVMEAIFSILGAMHLFFSLHPNLHLLSVDISVVSECLGDNPIRAMSLVSFPDILQKGGLETTMSP